jgi:hypothetical protein
MLMISYYHYNTAYNRTRIFKKWSKDKQRSSKQAREWEGMHYQFLVVNSRGEYDLEEVGGSPSGHTTWRPVLKAPVGHHSSPAGPWFIRCHSYKNSYHDGWLIPLRKCLEETYLLRPFMQHSFHIGTRQF